MSQHNKSQHELLHEMNALTALFVGAQRLSFTHEADKLPENIVQVCVDTFGVQAAQLYETELRNTLKLIAYAPPESSQSLIVPDPSNRRSSFILQAVQSSFPIVVRDSETAAELPAYAVTAAAFPLVSGGISFGALVLFSDQEDFFERERVRFFQAYAHQAASALQNGRLYQRLQRELDERKRAEQDLQHLNEELEERVRQRTGQLEAANEELEAFSYSISHDLRTPLRGILSFSSDLLEAFADKISPDALRMLKSINSSSIHMEELIESLLTFSRYIRKTPQKTTVDMTALAQSVIDELAKLDSIPKVNIDLEPLPSVIGDPALLRQVFVNLISNALKYSRTKPEREIRIDSFSHNGEIVFVVADNGVGFDMTYADRLFGVFQRLHSSEEFEGTGVGLAIVQRIIHRHGGRVWAEGSVDHGAKFYFSLPRIEHS